MGVDVFQPFIGIASQPVENDVEKGAVRKFAEAIGDPNPLYRDEIYARSSRYGRLIAPPTFSRVFDYGVIPGLPLPREGLIHGEQEFEYFAPLYVGETYAATQQLSGAWERAGKLGTMVFLAFEQSVYRPSGELVVRASSTVIYRPEEADSHGTV